MSVEASLRGVELLDDDRRPPVKRALKDAAKHDGVRDKRHTYKHPHACCMRPWSLEFCVRGSGNHMYETASMPKPLYIFECAAAFL